MKRQNATTIAPDGWREVHTYGGWDEADAQRSATIRDNPTLDVRLTPKHGRFILEVRRPDR